MFSEYFIKQMVNILHSPFYIFDKNKTIIKKYGEEQEVTRLYNDNPELIKKIFKLKKDGIPGILTENHWTFIVFYEESNENEILIAGPILLEKTDKKKNIIIKKAFHINEKSDYKPSFCNFKVMISGVLLLNWCITKKEISETDLLEKNKENFLIVGNLYYRITEDIFRVQENEGMHNPYNQELRELDSIEKGDIEALAESIGETYTGEIGILAKDPLRSNKNVAIGNITLASRAAIRGGISVEQSFSIADSLIRQVEDIDNVPEVEAFKHESKFAYARLVAEESRRERGSKKENPIILQVKDYVFNHLHESIQVSDIASSMKINPDYLSHLFSSVEKITITEYVRQEKIRRGKNLLKYSEYKIQEIAFYLGFCSQSHFTKIFQNQVGIRPSEYRKKYGNQKKWKTEQNIVDKA